MSIGKNFEVDFAKQLREQLQDEVVIQRLYDNMSKFALHYPSDYILFTKYGSHYIECKATKDKSFYFSGFAKHQVEEMKQISKNKANVDCFVVIFFYSKGVTKAFNIDYIVDLIESGEKKVSYDDEFCVELYGKKKRLYFEYNMKRFVKELDGEFSV